MTASAEEAGASRSREDKAEAALEEFRKAWFSGEALDPDVFCRDHAECGSALREEIEDFLFVVDSLPGDGAGDQAIQSGVSGAGDFEIGKTLGEFRLIREIGRGGMGTVYEAKQIHLKRRVALKILLPHLSFSREAVLKFRREAEAGAKPSHPGIVAIYAVGEHEGIHYIAQEFVEGSHTLMHRLDEFRKQEKPPSGYFREVAQLIAEVADALHHAHESGVIHRDVKPSNILLTKEGLPKVADFGLAKIEDALALSRTGDFSGTPYYMSPEQAMSRRIGIDRRTDIYSLGVTLYEMLCLRRPFEGETSQDILKKIVFVDPVDPHRLNSRVPRDLSTICLKAMEKQPEGRYQSMADLAGDLRRFLAGESILAKPAGIRTRVWRRIRRNPVVTAAVGIASLTMVASLCYVLFISYPLIRHERNIATEEKERALVAEIRAEEQARIARERYEDIIRLSDVKRVKELEERAGMLWPACPENIERMKVWLDEAKALLARMETHRRILADLREKAVPCDGDSTQGSGHSTWKLEDTESQWQHDVLAELVSGLERLADEKDGILNSVKDRLAFAATIEKQSIGDHQKAWTEAMASIADEEECPLYKGLVIKPVTGFIPIGRDPESGLWEFAHLQTGEIPERGDDGKIVLTEEAGLVFVLIPGGAFNMGAVPPSLEHPIGSPNVDQETLPEEAPVHEVAIKPFFLSKYEMTQAQWLRFTGDNPSTYNPQQSNPNWNRKGRPITLLHPVEKVSWDQCVDVLFKLNLRLPSESEWEYACRAGTTTVWWTGDDKKTLRGAVNIADHYCKTRGGRPGWSYEEWLDDGYTVHAPVGRFRPNAFGLHDVHGNLWEWCRDAFGKYENAPVDGSAFETPDISNRVFRGGSLTHDAFHCRSASRGKDRPDLASGVLGLRPACGIN